MHCPARLRSGAGAGPTSTSTQRSCSIAACSGASTSGSASCSVSGSGLWRRTQWRRQQSSAHATPCHRAAAAPVAAASSAYLASAQAHALGGIRPFACGRSAFPTSGQQQQARRASIVAAAAGNGNGNGHRVEDVENVVIVGSGPAGYTAAIYAARANLKPVVFEGFQSGRGGQLMGTTEVENFPGFPEGVTGPELMDKMRKQAERWGAELYTEDVDHIDLDTRPFVIRTPERTVRAHSVIMATGASALRLNLPSEDQYWSKGISACAICDGASPLFKGRVVAVVGGGDSACEEAVYLTKYASHVHLIVRRSQLRASKAMQDRTLAHPRITVHFNTEVDDVYGAEVLHGLKLRDANTGEQTDLPAAGLFYGIGHKPNSDLIAGRVELDEKGYVKVHHGVSTNVEGVFAAGDLHDPEWRQAITAAGSGCQAALSVERYLTKRGLAREFQNLAAASMDNGSAHSAPAAAVTPEVSPEEEFDINQDKHKGQFALRKLYHSSDRPLAVLYTAPSCGPCRSLKPILNGVMDEYKGRIHYVEIDIEVDPEIAEAAGVAGTPTFQLFKDKEQIVSVAGVKLKREYRSFINEALGVPVAV